MRIHWQSLFLCLAVICCLGIVEAVLPVQAQSPDSSPLVLAFYYNWYDENTWVPDKVIDRPLEAYVSRDRAAMVKQVDAPNAFGLYDMLGNVREWCQDSYASYTDTPTDGSAYRSKGDKKAMVLRGGSWYYLPYFVRSSFRSRHDPADQYDSIGFRVAVSRTP